MGRKMRTVASKFSRRILADGSDPLLAAILRRSFTANMLGGMIGGASHTLLDSIMHPDIQPLWPLLSGNVLYRALSVPTLHLGCVVTALFGIGILLANRPPQADQKD
jgi:membrane-bound metal-dependent hydrolase YbcI (DUF457 family)